MGSKKDPIEAKFDEDLQKAMALSMETHALEEIRKSRDTTGKKFINRVKRHFQTLNSDSTFY